MTQYVRNEAPTGTADGGVMYYICEYDKKAQAAREFQGYGAAITDFMFDRNGVTSWGSKNE